MFKTLFFIFFCYTLDNIRYLRRMKKFSMILAADNENGIGVWWILTWDISDDRKYFKEITILTQDKTKKNAVVMGRKTWDSLPEKFRPLPGRVNFVLSRDFTDKQVWEAWEIQFSDLKKCMEYASIQKNIEKIFIIGWAEIYNQALKAPCLDKIYLTRIYNKFHCDVFFDGVPDDFEEISRSETKTSDWYEYEFFIYARETSIFKKIKQFFKK